MVGIAGWWGSSGALRQAEDRCLDTSRYWLLRGRFSGIFFSVHLHTRRFLWKSEHSQLNTLAISIFHFDRGVFFFCPDGLFRLGWVPVWSYGHSLGETFGVVERSWFLGLDLCLGHVPLLVMASSKFLNLSELQASPAQGCDDTIPTVAGGPRVGVQMCPAQCLTHRKWPIKANKNSVQFSRFGSTSSRLSVCLPE